MNMKHILNKLRDHLEVWLVEDYINKKYLAPKVDRMVDQKADEIINRKTTDLQNKILIAVERFLKARLFGKKPENTVHA